jgi:hypothetical protein
MIRAEWVEHKQSVVNVVSVNSHYPTVTGQSPPTPKNRSMCLLWGLGYAILKTFTFIYFFGWGRGRRSVFSPAGVNQFLHTHWCRYSYGVGMRSHPLNISRIDWCRRKEVTTSIQKKNQAIPRFQTMNSWGYLIPKPVVSWLRNARHKVCWRHCQLLKGS